MSVLLQQAFRAAASELGMASAAWLFVKEAGALGGADGVAQLRDALGRLWPVLDAVCVAWQTGCRQPLVAPETLLSELAGASRVVVVGMEAAWLDALVPRLPVATQVGLIQHGDTVTDWARVASNFAGRVKLLQLADFQSWAGPRSVLLTFIYGQTQDQVFVLPGWLRVCGADVRVQFRALLGWRVLNAPMDVYPRWLVAASADTLTGLCPPQWQQFT